MEFKDRLAALPIELARLILYKYCKPLNMTDYEYKTYLTKGTDVMQSWFQAPLMAEEAVLNRGKNDINREAMNFWHGGPDMKPPESPKNARILLLANNDLILFLPTWFTKGNVFIFNCPNFVRLPRKGVNYIELPNQYQICAFSSRLICRQRLINTGTDNAPKKCDRYVLENGGNVLVVFIDILRVNFHELPAVFFGIESFREQKRINLIVEDRGDKVRLILDMFPVPLSLAQYHLFYVEIRTRESLIIESVTSHNLFICSESLRSYHKLGTCGNGLIYRDGLCRPAYPHQKRRGPIQFLGLSA